MSTINNVRQMAKARGFKLSKVRSPYIEDEYVIVTYSEAADAWTPMFPDSFTLAEAEAWLREQPTLERGR